MRRTTLAVLCLALACTILFCDTAGAQVISLTTEPGTPVVRIDPNTGFVQPVVSTNAPSVSGGLSALDAAGRRVFFSSGGSGSQVLHVVDIQTQSVADVPIPNLFAYAFFEYDPTLGRILSISSEPGTPVVTINPETGVVQPLVNTNAPSVSGGLSALDVSGRRLFFSSGMSGSQVLNIVNLQTLAVTSVPIPNSFSYAFFEFDPLLGRILSISSAPGTPVVTIDPDTGVVLPLVDTNAPSVSGGMAAFDPTGRRLFSLGGVAGAQVLYIVSLQSLSVSSVPIPNPFSYGFLEFDPGVATAAVPIGRFGLFALALGIATIGGLILRR